MTYSELPEAYQYLVRLRTKTNGINEDISNCFVWTHTVEGAVFWLQVECAKTIKDLPKLKPRYRINHDLTITKLW